MNFYKRFPGDYAKKTARLTLAQHGAYSLLLDEIYVTEAPLPADLDELYRVCRAMTADEQAAVRMVAERFFPVGEDGLRRNERAEEELAAAAPAIEAARANGRKGGRPKKKPSGFSGDNPEGTGGQTQEEPTPKAPHSPDTQPSLRSGCVAGEVSGDGAGGDEGAGAPAVVTPTAAGLACRAMKAAGMAIVNPSDPRLTALLAAGITLDELSAAAADAVKKGKPFAYALAVAEGRRRDAAAVAPLPAARSAAAEPALSFAERDRRDGWKRWEERTGHRHPELERLRAEAPNVIDVQAEEPAILRIEA